MCGRDESPVRTTAGTCSDKGEGKPFPSSTMSCEVYMHGVADAIAYHIGQVGSISCDALKYLIYPLMWYSDDHEFIDSAIVKSPHKSGYAVEHVHLPPNVVQHSMAATRLPK